MLQMPGGENAPAANPYASLSGPANAFDAEVASADRKFDDEMPISNSQKLKLAVPAKSDIALYETVDLLEKKEPKRYFAMFKYLALDPAPNGTETKTFRQKPFEVFNTTSPYPGTGLQMQGLTADNKVVVRGTLAYRFVAGSKKEKGVLAVYQEA